MAVEASSSSEIGASVNAPHGQHRAGMLLDMRNVKIKSVLLLAIYTKYMDIRVQLAFENVNYTIFKDFHHCSKSHLILMTV